MLLLLWYSSRTAGWSYAQPRLWSVGYGMRDAEKIKERKRKKKKGFRPSKIPDDGDSFVVAYTWAQISGTVDYG